MPARLRVLFLILGFGLALAGCEGKVVPTCPTGKLCIHAGNGTDPATLDPAKTQLVTEDNIISDLFVGLVTDDVHGKAMPGMAQSWTTSADGLTWTFKLRDALWSDGVPVTADDFVFSLRRLVDPKTAAEYAYFAFLIKNGAEVNAGKLPLEALGVRAIDPKTLEIVVNHPTAYLPQILKHQVTYAVPAHVVRKWGDAWSRQEHYVSNGPYTLSYWRMGDRIRLVKNPRFYDAKNVCLDEVYYYPTTDTISAERRVRRGELDIADGIAANRLPYLRKPDQIPAYVHSAPYMGVYYLAFNTHVPALADKRVRTALSMTIDRDFIAAKLLAADKNAAYSFVPPDVADYPGGAKLFYTGWPFDKRLAYARTLLAQAGYGPQHPLKVDFKTSSSGTAEPSVVLAAIQSDWRSIGVQASLTQEDGQVFFSDLNVRNFEIGIAGWIADYDDATTFLMLLKSDTGAQNYGDYHNPAYDALLEQSDHTVDAKARGQVMVKAEQIALDDVGVAPIYFAFSRNLVNPSITGWIDNIMDHHRMRWVCFKDAAERRARSRG